jgi:hypothetical protein
MICSPIAQIDIYLTDDLVRKIFQKCKINCYSTVLGYMLNSVSIEARMALFRQMNRCGVIFDIFRVARFLKYFAPEDKEPFLAAVRKNIIEDVDYLSVLSLTIDKELNETQQLIFYFSLYSDIGIKALSEFQSSNLATHSILKKYAACITSAGGFPNQVTLAEIYSPYFYLLPSNINISYSTIKLDRSETKLIDSRFAALEKTEPAAQTQISTDAAAKEFIDLIQILEKEIKPPDNTQPSASTWSFFSIFSTAPTPEDDLIQKILRLRHLHKILVPNEPSKQRLGYD